MNEQKTVPVVESTSNRKSILPFLLVALLLLFLIPLSLIFSRWLLDNCIQAADSATKVLGITNLVVDAQLDEAKGGENVLFNVTGKNNGILSNGTVTFDVTGKGTLQSKPVGSGVCVLTSTTRATCTSVNLLANDQVNYVVPVAVSTACGLLDDDKIGLDVDIKDATTQDVSVSGNIGCKSTSAGTTPTPSPTPNPSGTPTPTPTPSGTPNPAPNTGTGSESTTDKRAADLAACYTYSNNGLLLGACLSLLLTFMVFAVSYWATRRQTLK